MGLIPPHISPEGVSEHSAVEWEETACPLCDGRNWSLLIEAPDFAPGGGLRFAVVQCHGCGLCFTNPRPTAASIAHFYSAQYRPHQLRVAGKRRFKAPAFLRGRERERKALPWHGQGRLLDFGCGGGSYLERMAKQGWQVTGLDASPAAVTRVRRELGLHAVVGTLPHPQLERGVFDVITMWHSLEHVHEPLEALRAAHELLAPGGRLLVAAPNIDSLAFRWFGPAWFGLDLPRHLIHFTPPTLCLMLERAGFRPQPVRMQRHSEWFRSSARRALTLASPAHAEPWCRWLARKPLSRLATWYSALTGQADSMIVTADK